MHDEFRHLKGVLGQELAKLYLRRIRKYVVIAEEVVVEGLNPRACLDLVVRDEAGYRPVEVKMQQYNIPTYGKAFQYVLSRLNQGKKVYSLLDGEGRLELTRPILFLWYPPAKEVKHQIEGYDRVELFQFGDVIQALGEQAKEMVIREISAKVEYFFKKHNCQLTPSQKVQMEELYPDWYIIDPVIAKRLVNVELMKKVGQMIMAGAPEKSVEGEKVYWKIPFLVVPPESDPKTYPIGKYALVDALLGIYELSGGDIEELKAKARPILYKLYPDLEDWMKKVQEAKL